MIRALLDLLRRQPPAGPLPEALPEALPALPDRTERDIPEIRKRGGVVDTESPLFVELRELRLRVPHVTGVLVASVDGMLIAQDTPGIEPEVFAAMSAAQLGLGQQLVATLRTGDFRETVTAATHGYVATFAAGPAALLTVVAGPELNVARLHHEARPVAARIGQLVATAYHPA
ncbi:hypothetical protein Cs7R123_25830 [Catellatospora sp. TT07R-123]|uniref:roadblock/LC7 domain-containing protein n=1 Tax=Catellatospora sp. TT07R-123 TaxID=2733863 RepID=UPI001B28EAF5|nr:roadblock/LC7 domain-containing protein [Catellatospora sp. TT07R-123]GHJ45241.1 hypothetical protein Cs7R123_25830 [Catellatospora sp. TT07R-123]